MQDRLFEHRLQAGGHVVDLVGVGAAGLARGAEELHQPVGVEAADVGRALVPGHLDALADVAEELGAEGEAAGRLQVDQLAELVEVAGLAVGRQAHHLALVAVLGEAEPLGDGGVDDAERVGVEDLALDLDVAVAPAAPHGGHEVAKTVQREHRGLVEGRGEEGAGQVSAVVLDGVLGGAQAAGRHAEGGAQRVVGLAQAGDVAQAVLQRGEHALGAALRDAGGDVHGFLQQVRLGVAGEGDVVDVLRAHARHLQTGAGGQGREAGAVLLAVEALLLDGRGELSIDEEGGAGVPMVGVQTEDDHFRQGSASGFELPARAGRSDEDSTCVHHSTECDALVQFAHLRGVQLPRSGAIMILGRRR